jgi:hypothetical protein
MVRSNDTAKGKAEKGCDKKEDTEETEVGRETEIMYFKLITSERHGMIKHDTHTVNTW